MFEAPRHLVFTAWTDPRQIARWFGPVGITTPLSTISLDVRPGGVWQLRMIDDADGAEYPLTFICREVVEPERLVLSTRVPTGPGPIVRQAVLTVTLAELGDRTEMTFHVTGLAMSEENAGLESGWSSSFDRLAEHLTPVAPTSSGAAR
ncbi:SRPBCC domain-containing protein [Micromonospora sp. DR5-3]|uniref:SRPBCC family protein n=1 Tax=unclassified Micromonospora TaxID=2617518 RepID=UPI001CA329DF|nr:MULTISPECIES: SRPBCC domain-containing protein [unclassified Micromonospora]MCW3819444.1 SRPBCC domain-containing protein [Micromonospora sp. DR5-3]